MLQVQAPCCDRETISKFASIFSSNALSSNTKLGFKIHCKYNRAKSFLSVFVNQMTGLTEGFSLSRFCAEQQEEICKAAIECEIETVELICGKIKYIPFNPKVVLPLLMLNRKLVAGVEDSRINN